MSIDIAGGSRRFDALLSGTGNAACDRPLLEGADWLVAPSLGAIVPGWLLLVPRRHRLSFREWGRDTGEDPDELLSEIRDRLGLSEDEVIWFEHGPASVGTTVGCGLDHAHIHILVRPPFRFSELELAAKASTSLVWQNAPFNQAYAALPHSGSYLIAGSGHRAIFALDVETAGSQFFRRIIAQLVGLDAAWDYRRFSHDDNIAATISMVASLENPRRRGH